MTERWQQAPSAGSSRWLSREYSELLQSLGTSAFRLGVGGLDFDLLIVGSGYGAAVAAAELAGCVDERGAALKVGVLERGREYLPGSFPARMADLPTELRGSVAGRARGGECLFDVRIGADLNVVLANGLGGGSLINAGVMEIPHLSVFDAHWPRGWREDRKRGEYYERAKQFLGAADASGNNTIERHADGLPDKTKLMQRMASGVPQSFEAAAITVAMQHKTTVGGVDLKPCKRCGDCASGCNYGAKESLDTNLLVQACRRGAEIYCGATVLRLERAENGEGWRVSVTHADENLRLRDSGPVWLTANRVILAAGSLGSTEILLRSQRTAQAAGRPLAFSTLLGQRFSGNGDMLSFGYDMDDQGRAIADEDSAPGGRGIGPTITGIIRTELKVKGESTPQHIVIEDLAVPGPLKRFTEEMLTTADTLHRLGTMDFSCHKKGYPADDPHAVQPNKIARTMVFAAMGNDGAKGSLQLREADTDGQGDGALEVRWPALRTLPLFDAQNDMIAQLAGQAKIRGRIIANPLWRLLPGAMDSLIGGARGPLMTVHPLGGCPMGDDAGQGVVNEFGEVFDADGSSIHDGLLVLDGAMVPGALSTNPALTIAALALRAVEKHRKAWGWQRRDQGYVEAAHDHLPRPWLADVEADIAQRSKAVTEANLTERLSGPLTLIDADGKPQRCRAELTLSYLKQPLQDLFRPDENGRMVNAKLTVAPGSGLLSIYTEKDWQDLRDLPPNHPRRDPAHSAALSFEVSGELVVLRREASRVIGRTLRGLAAWLPNRGARDLWQMGEERWSRWRHKLPPPPLKTPITDLLLGPLRLASRAGEVRLFEYALRIGKRLPSTSEPGFQPKARFSDQKLNGLKRITYARPSNPWRQLMELTLTECPGLAPMDAPPVLELDPAYFAARAAPLVQITGQRDGIEALADVASLGAYFLRMMLSIHLWQARKPEKPPPRAFQRLPGTLPGLPPPEVHMLEVDRLDGAPVEIRLSRYRSPAVLASQARAQPVLMIHGYSASGTSYAHPSLEPSLVQRLAAEGMDAWVLDLRTSCGMPLAEKPWTFERVALMDIPAAVDHVWQQSGQQPLDVIAHCMGAVMFSMAVLSAKLPMAQVLSGREKGRGNEVIDRFQSQRRVLPPRIRRAVLSQVGPLVVMRPENIFRAYVLSFFEAVLGPLRWRFRRPEQEGEMEALLEDVLDRLLATLPYPDPELLKENPWQPWAKRQYAAVRHRMDALYGRTFSLANMSEEVLQHIDDFFGPLSPDTLGQVMHFASLRTITNRAGRNRFVSRDRLRELWKFPTLSLHGSQNGLADLGTLRRMERVFDEVGVPYDSCRLADCGHQDSLIGTQVALGFQQIAEFLADHDDTLKKRLAEARHDRLGHQQQKKSDAPPPVVHDVLLARPPAYGPMLVALPGAGDEIVPRLSLGAASELPPFAVCLYPLRWDAQARQWKADRQQVQVHSFEVIGDSDWLTVPLPGWASDGSQSHLLALMLYEHCEVMAMPAFHGGIDILKAGKARPMQPDNVWSELWRKSHSGLGASVQTLLRQRPGEGLFTLGHGASPPPAGPAAAFHHALHAAIDHAMLALGQQTAPPGMVFLPGKPVERAATLRLALGSCQYPPGLLDRNLAYQAWRDLSAELDRGVPAPHLMVLTGDQVYTDASAGLFDPARAADRYHKPYEQWLGQPDVKDLLRRIPVVTQLDDHELIDNWEPPGQDPAQRPARRQHKNRRRDGLEAFHRYQRGQPAGLHPPWPEPWMQLKAQGLPLFVLDTRSERKHRAANGENAAAICSPAQWQALLQWLRSTQKTHAHQPKIIVCPALLLPRKVRSVPAELAFGCRDANQAATLRSDAWAGYPPSLFGLLQCLVDENIQQVLLLSGDEHLGLHTRITLSSTGKPDVRLHSIHSPGLYAPFRFANAKPQDFLLDEQFDFALGNQRYGCAVKTRVFDTPGFVLVTLAPNEAGSWQLRCRSGDGQGAREIDEPL